MTTFAVIKTGGKQYKVSKGEFLKIEKIRPKVDKQGQRKELVEGDKVLFNEVLLLDDGKKTTVGTPFIKGAKVEAEIQKIGRAKKISVIRFRAKSRHFKRKGHRQPFFQVKINSIK